ncbi:MAG: hypothetical protein V3T70_06475 [Phycisphaerae bacterium]
MKHAFWLIAIPTIVVGLMRPASAQEQPPRVSTPETDPQNPGLWNTEAMMENAVQQLTRRYNLNETQEAYTRQLLMGRVREFLREHESEVRGLLAEAIEVQLNPSKVNADRMQTFGERALPIYEAAKKAILDGNQEWRITLNDAQKRIHQRDLDQMDRQFSDMDEKFGRWAVGGFKPEDLYPRPPRNVQTAGRGGTTTRRVPGVKSKAEDFWETWVKQRIALYKYSDEQRNSAMAILRDCLDQAADYRRKNRERLDGIEVKMAGLRGSADHRKEFAKLTTELSELLRPIRKDLFDTLRNRVQGLATEQQRAAVEQARADRKRQKKLENPKKRTGGIQKQNPSEQQDDKAPAASRPAGVEKSAAPS